MNRLYDYLRHTKNMIEADIKSELKIFTSGNKSALLRDGFELIPNYLQQETCDLLREKVENVLKNDTNIEEATRRSFDGHNPYDTGMIDYPNIDSKIPELKTICKPDKILRLIREHTGQKLRLEQISAYINRGVSDPRSYHLDSIGSGQYKAFIYLTDVPDASWGPYSYIAGSHRFHPIRYYNLFKNFAKGYPMKDMRSYMKSREKIFTAPKGTLLISSQDGMHRGQPQDADKERMLLVFKFLSD